MLKFSGAIGHKGRNSCLMGLLPPPQEHIKFKRIHARTQWNREGWQHKLDLEFWSRLVLQFWYISKHEPTCWLEHWIVVRNSSTACLVSGWKNWFKWLLRVLILRWIWCQTVLNSNLWAQRRYVLLPFCAPQSHNCRVWSGFYSQKVES